MNEVKLTKYQWSFDEVDVSCKLEIVLYTMRSSGAYTQYSFALTLQYYLYPEGLKGHFIVTESCNRIHPSGNLCTYSCGLSGLTNQQCCHWGRLEQSVKQ